MPERKKKTLKASKKREENDFLEGFKSTADIPVSERLIDQIIGQEKACEVVKKAAQQKRNVLLVGVPGTGKSMLAQAMAELLPVQELEDILIGQNPLDENQPKVLVVKAGAGRKIIEAERMKKRVVGGPLNLLVLVFISLMIMFLLSFGRKYFSDVIIAAFLIGLMISGVLLLFVAQIGRARLLMVETETYKLLIDNSGKTKAPFVDATGARAGALLGDVKHDPLQTGGLGTPAHLRVEPGFIHRANKGVLYIDEISTLHPKAQQELLTAMQEKRYGISGQSEMSSGAMTRTEQVPCDFVLVASGNYVDIRKMHPALRSRIRGYGYEVYMEESIDDTPKNRKKLVQFVAQEAKKDGKIPHFSREAVEEIIKEARKRAGRKNKLTLKLRDLGGLVRAAGDIAKEQGANLVSREDLLKAKGLASTLEQQITQQAIDLRKDYQIFVTHGEEIGKVNGLAVFGTPGTTGSGLVSPIVAEVAPAASRQEGKIIATGKLGEIAREAVENVSAIIKKHIGKDIYSYDIHIQFIQTYEGVEGDSGSISVATAVVSALEEIPVYQSIAMTGSLSVRGEVLPVGGVTPKVEAAIEAGAKKVIIPKSNKEDLVLDDEQRRIIEIIPVSNIYEVLSHALKDCPEKKELLLKIKKEFSE
ncbi:ATP-dependent protease LonB [Candidatus Micrarchaeota archaeon]|nr:ATP-dependent protease LonB [Candidatus Micrarchaeota archaeon]